MKTWMLVAAVALAPIGAFAQQKVDEGVRAEFVNEIEATRTALLPQTLPLPQVTVKHQPKLNEVKAAVVAAKLPAEFEKAKKDFTEWKRVVLNALHAEDQKAMPTGETITAFSARRAREIGFVLAVRQQFVAQRAQTQIEAVRAVAYGPGSDLAAARVFDNGGFRAPSSFSSPMPAAGDDGAVRAETLPAGHPARYDKIRSLLLSQGVSKQIVDLAIAEGQRMKVDPMIVLSVINQESNFRKNAYNKGSGCTGLMQLDPATAADMGVHGSLYDPASNIKAGVKYLNWIANSFFKMNQDLSDMAKIPADRLKMILASYNWGIGNVQKAVRKHGAAALDVVAPKETRNYIAQIPSRIYNWFASF